MTPLAHRPARLWETPEYRSMAGAKHRCTGKKYHARHRYRSRGVEFKFLSVVAATDWVLRNLGQRPTPQHSIDRYPDKDGHYEPGNLRWATKSEQALNRNDPNKAKTHCANGHPFNGENLYILPTGQRRCRACNRERMRRHRSHGCEAPHSTGTR
jgi:hypothetical protein